jgi:hypothetical protein
MSNSEKEYQHKLNIMQLNELSLKDDECRQVLEEAARKVRLIASKKNLRFGQPLTDVLERDRQVA